MKFSALPLMVFTMLSGTLSAQDTAIYVSDAGNYNNPPWQILKFDANGQNPEVFIDSNLGWPQDIVFVEDQGVVLISNLNTGKISRHNANTGDYIDDFATGIGGPTRMKIGADTLLYVLQWNGDGKVKRYQMNGTFVDDFTSVGVPQSIGLDWDAQGNLYVSSYNGDHVRKFDSNGNDLGLFISSNLAGPTNIWFDSSGDLLVSDYDGTAVKRFDPNGNFVSDFLSGLSNSEGIAITADSSILVGNGSTNSVKRFDSNGNFIDDIVPSGSGNLLIPNAVVIRQINTSSISEIEKEGLQITPTVADAFYLKHNLENTTIEVKTSEGKIVHQARLVDELVWDATSASVGMYFITLKQGTEVILESKVTVQH